MGVEGAADALAAAAAATVVEAGDEAAAAAVGWRRLEGDVPSSVQQMQLPITKPQDDPTAEQAAARARAAGGQAGARLQHGVARMESEFL